MNRRQYLAITSTACTTAIAGCGGGGGDQSSGEGGGWDHEQTYTTTGEVEEAEIGELEEGDQVEFEVEVLEGRAVRAEIFNQDTGDYYGTRFVYRSDQIESFNESSQQEVASPYNSTITIEKFGEYYGQLAMIPDNLEVIMRFRVL